MVPTVLTFTYDDSESELDRRVTSKIHLFSVLSYIAGLFSATLIFLFILQLVFLRIIYFQTAYSFCDTPFFGEFREVIFV